MQLWTKLNTTIKLLATHCKNCNQFCGIPLKVILIFAQNQMHFWRIFNTTPLWRTNMRGSDTKCNHRQAFTLCSNCFFSFSQYGVCLCLYIVKTFTQSKIQRKAKLTFKQGVFFHWASPKKLKYRQHPIVMFFGTFLLDISDHWQLWKL